MALNINGTKLKKSNVNGVKCKKINVNGVKVWSSEIIVVGNEAEETDFVTGGFSCWTNGWMASCTTSQIQFCGGDGQQYSGGQSNNYLPTGYSEITINWSMWSDDDGYTGGVYLNGSDGSQITVISGRTYSLTDGVSYKIAFSAHHEYTRTVSVSINYLKLS